MEVKVQIPTQPPLAPGGSVLLLMGLGEDWVPYLTSADQGRDVSLLTSRVKGIHYVGGKSPDFPLSVL